MPEGFQIRVTADTITPSLARLARNLDAGGRRAVQEAMGQQVVSLTVRAFRDASLRAASWPPKRDGSPATLYRKGPLQQSIRITSVDEWAARVGSDRPYAAIHQLGGTTPAHVIAATRARFLAFQSGDAMIYRRRVNHPGSRIPARPFFPFLPNGQPTAVALERIGAVARAKIARLLRG